jgi:hypothetical protein
MWIGQPRALHFGKSLLLAKSDAVEQKATARFPRFDFPKRAKHWQPRCLTNLDHDCPSLAGSLLIESCENTNSNLGKMVAGSNCGQPFQPRREIVVVGCWVVSAAGAARCPPLHEDRQTK